MSTPSVQPGVQTTGAGAPAGVADTALSLVDITKRFPGVLANDHITLDVRHGEVLGLLGENGAGKSTLMNVVYGLYQPDEGEIWVGGKKARIRSPEHALELGIGMVHQHFMLVPDMTVAENVALGPSRLPGLTRLGGVEKRLRELSKRFGLNVEPHAVVEELPVGARQRVEIIKLLYRGADLLILDEPTAALTPPEWHELAGFIRSLADDGKAVVFISHKLDELFGLVDRCTVLRDGRVIDTVDIGQTDKPALARMMVGREVILRAERPIVQAGRPVLEVRDLEMLDDDGTERLHDVSFEVREGEVFGIAGVSGNGQNDLVDALLGLRKHTGGQIVFDGKELDKLDPRVFTDLGGAVIPEDRHRDAVANELTVLDNFLLREFNRPPYSRRGLLDFDKARTHTEQLIREYDVRTPGVDVPMRQLSGGNQQKAVLARELSRDPRLVIAFQPTRGLDVGAIEFVYKTLNAKKREGGAIILISFELDEILSLADRFAVMVRGRFLRVCQAGEASPETIGMLMGGEEVAA